MVYNNNISNNISNILISITGRRLTNAADTTDIVNFSPLCFTIQSGPLRFRSFNYFFFIQLYFITMASGINIYSFFQISKIRIVDIRNNYFGYPK